MSIALLVGANPAKCTTGPIVRLLAGKYVLRVEGALDSELGLKLPSGEGWYFFKDGKLAIGGLDIESARDVQVEFVKRGTENFINVFAIAQ